MSVKSALLIWVSVLFLASTGGVLADQARLPIIHVKTDEATALANGLSIGRQSKLLFPDIEERYDTFLSSLINQRQMKLLREQHLSTLFERLDKSHQDEILGVEATWDLVSESITGDGKLSTDEYRLVNFLPDLGFMPNGSGFAAFNQASSDNKPIVGRNLDWKVTPTFQNMQSVTVYKSDDRTIVNIGFAGLVSVLTGYNSDGLFLAGLNAEPYTPYYKPNAKPHKKHSSIGFDFKTLLASKGNSKKAVEFLSSQRYRHDLNILIADKKTAEVLEHSKAGTSKARNWESPLHPNTPWGKRQQIASVNCFTLLKMPNNCQNAGDLVRWKRFRELAIFNAHSPASRNEITALMTDTKNKRHEIFNQDTSQSIIFQPSNGKVFLYTNLTGADSRKPVYQAYFDFTETLVKNSKKTKSYFTFKTLSWFFIILLGASLWWFTKIRDPRHHKK